MESFAQLPYEKNVNELDGEHKSSVKIIQGEQYVGLKNPRTRSKYSENIKTHSMKLRKREYLVHKEIPKDPKNPQSCLCRV